MLTTDVKKLSPFQRFVYWIGERYQVYHRKRLNQPKPWTNDEVIQRTFFTMPYRELDKTTIWFAKTVREPLVRDPRVLMATAIFRWFNLIATGRILGDCPYDDFADNNGNLLLNWNQAEALERLGSVRTLGGQVFTGAYMINSPAGKPKLEAICERIENVWKDRKRLLDAFIVPLAFGPNSKCLTLEKAHEELTRYEGLGGFMAYEVVCDLRYTYLLQGASDKLTWCNPGPGCIRGLYRLAGEEWASKGNNATSPPKPKDWQQRMLDLLRRVQAYFGSSMPTFEMREIEHSLCEFDKYERVLWGDGKAKRTYPGV